MAIKCVLFDLDGTLLPQDLGEFLGAYLSGLAKFMGERGKDTDKLMQGMQAGIIAMVGNDGSRTNEEAFWSAYGRVTGASLPDEEAEYDTYYRQEYEKLRELCGFIPEAGESITALRDKGYRLVLATNPLYPDFPVESRMRWAGVEKQHFELVTTYRNSRHSKPNPMYYRDIADAMGVEPHECLMVGNDVSEDMAAEKVGMKVFLMPRCLINKNGEDISKYPCGGFSELLAYIESFN